MHFRGGLSSTGGGINDRGVVVGYSQVAGGHNHAFSWNPNTGMQDLGTLAGGGDSGAAGISVCDKVAGQSTLASGGANTHAVLWSETAIQDLGTLAGDNGSAAVAVNACGKVVGNSSLSAGGNLHAFLWTKAVGMVGLGVLPGFTDSGVHSLNNLGQVVGYCAAAGSANRGFVWSPAGIQEVGTLPGGVGSDAVGINDLGEIVGNSDSGDVNKPRAVLWLRTGIAQDLGVLPGGSWSGAFSINVLGTVVGNANWIGTGSHAFVWNARNGMKDLNTLIPPHSGWELQIAIAINVAGLIVGTGTRNGQQHAVLLTPR